jgi:putative FmdB family regulatory protein
MPIYEYRCHSCRRRVSILWRTFTDAANGQPVCPRCGGRELSRLVSKVAVLKSEEGRLDDLSDASSLSGLDEDDPKSIARWMRKMSSEMGEDLGDDLDEVVDRLEAGESPEEIEKTMPEMGEGEMADGDTGA